MDTMPPKTPPQPEQPPKVEPVKEVHHYHDERHHGPNLGKIFLGIIVIAFGILFLANNLGVTDINLQFDFNLIWPVLIIFIGLSLLSRRGWVGSTIGIVVTILVLAVVAWFAFGWDGSGVTPEDEITPISVERETDITTAEVSISTGAGTLEVAGSTESTDVVSGSLTSNFLTLDTSSTVADTTQSVELSTEGRWTGFGRRSNELDLILAGDIPYMLEFDTGAIDMDLDLRGVIAERVDISTGASDLTLRLGDLAATANVSIDAGASSIDITLPATVGAKVTIDSGVSSKTIEGFAKVDGNTYTTDDFGTAEKTITMDLDVGATSITIRRQ